MKNLYEKAQHFILDAEITDDRAIFEASPVPMYLVDDLEKVKDAYIQDMGSRQGFEDENDIGAFLDRHGIRWE